jgi:hypothetical protein
MISVTQAEVASSEEAPPQLSWLARAVPLHNASAVSAYYLAIFGLAPLVGLVLGPLALVLGMIGLFHALQQPEVRGGYHAIFAVVLGVVETVFNWSIALTLVTLHVLNFLDLSVLFSASNP